MPATAVNPFPPDALDANRRGELSADQLRGFRSLASYGRRSALSSAALLTGGALLIGLFASPSASIVMRTLLTVVGLTIAAFLVVRSVTGADALTRDLRRARVESIEGAIGKRSIGGGRARTTHLLDVGDATFKVGRLTYAAAPDAGYVRLYFLPHSRKVVNLERLPNHPLPDDVTTGSLADSMNAARRSRSRSQRNEALAEIAGVRDAFQASIAESAAAPPRGARDPRPLDQAIVGSWSNGVMKVAFSPDGRFTTVLLGAKKEGRWSVDGAGRLCADITGRHGAVDAWVAGNRLSVTIDGVGMTFTRDSTV